MNVKNVLLNGYLKEEVYIDPPPGYEIIKNKVILFKKALYKFKQTLKA